MEGKVENQIQIFEHEQFGKIRVVVIGGRIHFVAADVCRALDIKNPRDAFARLFDDEKKSIILPSESSKDGVTNSVGSTDGNNGATSGWIENRVNVVNEPGFYHLVFSSRKKEALAFQWWVYHEVLPSINATGSYSVAPAAAPAQLKSSKRSEGQKSPARVYVLLMSNNVIYFTKVGNTKDIRARVAQIKRETGLTVKKIFFTPFMTRKDARLVEWACREEFSPFKIEGEFYSADFNEVCESVNRFVKMVSAPPIGSVQNSSAFVLTSHKKEFVDKKL